MLPESPPAPGARVLNNDASAHVSPAMHSSAGREPGRLQRLLGALRSYFAKPDTEQEGRVFEQRIATDSPQGLTLRCKQEFAVFRKVHRLVRVATGYESPAISKTSVTGESLQTAFENLANTLRTNDKQIFTQGQLNPYAERSYLHERLNPLELVVENFRAYLKTGVFIETAYEETVFEKAASHLVRDCEEQTVPEHDGAFIWDRKQTFQRTANRLSFLEKRTLIEFGHRWSCFQAQSFEFEQPAIGSNASLSEKIKNRVGPDLALVNEFRSYLISARLRAVTSKEGG